MFSWLPDPLINCRCLPRSLCCICLSACMYFCVCLPACLSACLPVCLPACLPVYLPCSVFLVLLWQSLFFLDQNISSRVVNSPRHKMVKGPAYHQDMLVLGLITGLLSIVGLPWQCAATVQVRGGVLRWGWHVTILRLLPYCRNSMPRLATDSKKHCKPRSMQRSRGLGGYISFEC